MTDQNTDADGGSGPSPEPGSGQAAPVPLSKSAPEPLPEPASPPEPEPLSAPLPGHPAEAADAPVRFSRELRTDLLLGLALIAGSAVLGLLMGLLWERVAPKVPLYADTSDIYLSDPEGEQAITADAYFAIIGAVIGLLLAALAYWRTRARDVGVGVPVGLALGGLLGGYLAMRLGVHLGPSSNIIATAKSVALGKTFYGPLAVTANGVLLAWPGVALVTLIVLTRIFSPKPSAPETLWAQPLSQASPERSDTP
ncbi:hypothetical protein [Streptacidiphilus albus]|uniref:hypothetical protein n=1 Tax=Streptacidiphilus albus TaxID=105425 RepID=UPI000689F34B|nr:hypothetical protein [Streptacidiphilus albus]